MPIISQVYYSNISYRCYLYRDTFRIARFLPIYTPWGQIRETRFVLLVNRVGQRVVCGVNGAPFRWDLGRFQLVVSEHDVDVRR